MTRSMRSLRLVAAVLLALTTLLAGFAHRPLALGADAANDQARLVLPDGSVPVICGPFGSQDPAAPGSHGATAFCDACLLTAAPGLGAVPEVALPAPAAFVIGRVVVADLVGDGMRLFAPSSRGPPRRV